MDTSDLLLPEQSILLHIGPYKTGSTSIQYAMHENREELARHGVLYPGTAHRQRRPGWAVLGKTPPGRPPAREHEWSALLAEVHGTVLPRVCISTEDFARAGAAKVRRIATDLGPSKVHVVMVARRLDRLLPSQWQERVKTCRETKSYADWLAVVLDPHSSDPSARAFRASHDLPAVLARWLKVLPPERITVVATDDSDFDLLPRTFEAMLALPQGMLTGSRVANTSLTEEKVELIRRINEQFDEEGWDPRTYLRLVQQGASADMAAAPRTAYDVRIPPLPSHAVARVREMSDRRIEVLQTSGVRLVGDPACLRISEPTGEVGAAGSPEAISLEAAALAVHGAVRGALSLLDGANRPTADLARPAAPLLDDVSGRDLLRAAARRASSRLTRRR